MYRLPCRLEPDHVRVHVFTYGIYDMCTISSITKLLLCANPTSEHLSTLRKFPQMNS